jgi:predicted dehydrogenase
VAPLEDNAFILLQARSGQVANLHTSWTMWKNRFSFEVFGRDGYARVDGLGGSYGLETLTVGSKTTEGTAPAETVMKFERPDESWEGDWRDLIISIEQQRDPEVGADDGLAVMRLVHEVYSRAAKTSPADMWTPSRS